MLIVRALAACGCGCVFGRAVGPVVAAAARARRSGADRGGGQCRALRHRDRGPAAAVLAPAPPAGRRWTAAARRRRSVRRRPGVLEPRPDPGRGRARHAPVLSGAGLGDAARAHRARRAHRLAARAFGRARARRRRGAARLCRRPAAAALSGRLARTCRRRAVRPVGHPGTQGRDDRGARADHGVVRRGGAAVAGAAGRRAAPDLESMPLSSPGRRSPRWPGCCR